MIVAKPVNGAAAGASLARSVAMGREADRVAILRGLAAVWRCGETFSQDGAIERDFDDFNGQLPHFQKAPAT